jgi:hypothetical protein
MFDLVLMPFIGLVELTEKWNHCGMGTLDEISELLGEAACDDELFSGFVEKLNSLLTAVTPAALEELNYDHLFTIYTDDGGTPVGIRDVGIFQHFSDPSLMVLKLGTNMFSVQMDGGDLVCGTLRGTPEFTQVGDAKAGKAYYRVAVSFTDDSAEQAFDLMCVMSQAKDDDTSDRANLLRGISKADSTAKVKLSKEIKAGNLSLYLMPCMTGGYSNYIDMRELEIGEYEVLNIEEGKEHPEYGRSFAIVIAGGDKVNARGNIVDILKSNLKVYQAMLAKGKRLTWAITSKVKLDESRTQMKSSIWVRAPHNAIAPAPQRAQLESSESRQLATVGASNGAVQAKLIDTDQIPF